MGALFEYHSIAKETTDCPLCDHSVNEMIWDRDRYGMGIRTVICRRCGFVFTNPRPTEAELASFYAHHYRNYYENAPVPTPEYLEKGRFAERAAWNLEFFESDLEEVIKKDGDHRFLDIGCAQGSLLMLLRQRYGARISLHGVEPSLEFSKYARHHSGASIFTGVLEGYMEASSERQCFTYINLSHVLEHILQPLTFLRRIHQLLRPKGRLCVEVPNILGKWSGIGMFHIGHVCQFCPQTFLRASHQAGFSVLRQDLTGNDIHPWKMTFLLERADAPLSPVPYPSESDIAEWKDQIVRRTEPSLLDRIKWRLASA